MEQGALGGLDSVRAYPISDALGDRGYHVAVEYQVDAPGFGDKASPFGGRPWREVVQFELFADHGRVSSVGSAGSPGRTFDGAGAGLRFHSPDTHGLDFRLAAAVPIGSEDASDGDDFRSEEHTSELQSLMRISYAVFCLKKKKHRTEQQKKHVMP